jgi:hypothetical protein
VTVKEDSCKQWALGGVLRMGRSYPGGKTRIAQIGLVWGQPGKNDVHSQWLHLTFLLAFSLLSKCRSKHSVLGSGASTGCVANKFIFMFLKYRNYISCSVLEVLENLISRLPYLDSTVGIEKK